MQEYPHRYRVGAASTDSTSVRVSSPGLETLETTPPPEFGGPEGYWSPETLLVASVANCYIFTFRAIARASKMEWLDLKCEVEGVLDRVERVTQFTSFHVKAELTVPRGVSEKKAQVLLEKAKTHCLVTNSLKSTETLEARVVVSDS